MHSYIVSKGKLRVVCSVLFPEIDFLHHVLEGTWCLLEASFKKFRKKKKVIVTEKPFDNHTPSCSITLFLLSVYNFAFAFLFVRNCDSLKNLLYSVPPSNTPSEECFSCQYLLAKVKNVAVLVFLCNLFFGLLIISIVFELPVICQYLSGTEITRSECNIANM